MEETTNPANPCGRKPQGLCLALGITAVVAAVSFGYQTFAGRNDPESAPPQTQVERGRYLVTITGCNDCHTPFKMTANGPAPDMDRMLSGHPEQFKLPDPPKAKGPWIWSGAATNTAFAGPWGVTYAANLTPDKNTGLGIWDVNMFIQAMRTGKHFGQGRAIQPPMPIAAVSKMTEEDLRAVFAYLRSVPPLTNHVPDYQAPE